MKGFVVSAEYSKDPACGKVWREELKEGGREGGRERGSAGDWVMHVLYVIRGVPSKL